MKVISKLAGMRRAASAMLAFGLSSLVLTPAYASDTEVYLRPTGDGSSPTLMMFLDSSSVMLKCMSGDTDCTNDFGNSRINALRNSIQNVLNGEPVLQQAGYKTNSTTGAFVLDASGNKIPLWNWSSITKPAPGYVKLGYARNNPRSNDGGWVRFPATKLDDPSPIYTARIVVPVSLPLDDSTSSPSDPVNYIKIGNGATPAQLRFANVTIPKNATVVSARLAFTYCAASGTNSNATCASTTTVASVPAVDIKMRLDSNAPAPTSISNVNDALQNTTIGFWGTVPSGNTTYGTTGAKGVTVVASGASGYLNVTPLIDGIVKGSYNGNSSWDWCGGNAIALRLDPSTASGGASNQSWTVFSYDGTPRLADGVTPNPKLVPRLEIVYQVPTSPTDYTKNTCTKPFMETVAAVQDSLDDVSWQADGVTGNLLRPDITTSENGVRPGYYETVNSVVYRNYVAVRFPNVQVPQNATNIKAYLYATGACVPEGGSCPAPAGEGPFAALRVRAFIGNTPPFCSSAANCTTLPNRSNTTAAIDWTSIPTTTVKAYNHALDVSSLVQQAIASNWDLGKALGFLIYSNSSTNYPNVGLSTFDTDAASAMRLHIIYQSPDKINDISTGKITARQGLAGDVDAFLWAEGGTPIGDAYDETARYMLGNSPLYTTTVTTDFAGNVTSATYPVPDPTVVSAGKYVSPVPTSSICKPSSGIFMMSGGVNANASNVQNNASKTLTNDGTADYGATSVSSTNVNSSGTDKANFQALVAVATALGQGKNRLGINIFTNVVLFRAAGGDKTSAMYLDLNKAATNSGGKFFEANDEAQLTASLNASLSDVIDVNGSITAPGVAVNQFNRLSHLDQLYYAVFDPPAKPVTARWLGNVKRYRLKFLDDATSSSAIIADAEDKNAVNYATGFFLDTAKSFWSGETDGNSVIKGGAASKLPSPATRKIFTNLGPVANDDLTLVQLQNADLAKAKAAMGLSTTEQVTNLTNWLLGYKIYIKNTDLTDITTTLVPTTTSQRYEMGGVLHSQPVLVNYGYLSGASLTSTDTNPATSTNPNVNAEYQDNTVFFSTMEGMLHAVDAKTGVEQFAFMPKAVMPTAKRLALETPLSNPTDLPAFGLDSTWTPWRVDGDGNLKIETGTASDRMWMFGGMRMGGRNYYALDVKDRTAPVLKWKIDGGSTVDFKGLGYTWSQPVLANVKIGGTVTPVLFVGGGYDLQNENVTAVPTSDSMGAWFYIINALTGQKIFSASGMTNAGENPDMTVSTMKWNITGSPKLFDADQDGLVDAVYFGDLAGQVFRVDLNNPGSTGNSTLVKRILRIANLGQQVNPPTTQTVVENRRFFESPSVAIIKPTTGDAYVAVALGSGNRAHPLNVNTSDRFYMLKDTDVLRKDILTTTSFTVGTITPSDLAVVDPTSLAGATMTNKKGWQMAFTRSGEKVMSKAIILLGEVLFTTYTPDTSPEAACTAAPGYSRLYRMSVLDGAATYDFTKDGTLDRSAPPHPGLVGEPQPFVDSSGKNAILTGTGVERNRDLQTPGLRRTRWYMMQKK